MATTDQTEKPLVFISCGQYTQEEKDLGKAIERIIREMTPFEAYFAEQQNTLEGLTSNILSSLGRCMGFVAVAHQRGSVKRPDGEIVRASVWIEQEIAIAAFIQHVLGRKIEVALYMQKGIQREGIREQLRLAPVMFDTADDVLADFRQRVADWRLSPLPKHALVADWKRKTERRTQDHHDYRLVIDLVNKGSKLVSEWRVRVEIPREFVKVGQGNNWTIVLEEDSEKLPADEREDVPEVTERRTSFR